MSRMKSALAVAGTLVVLAGPAGASEYQDGWGPAVGSPMPAIEARDQTRTVRDLASPCSAPF